MLLLMITSCSGGKTNCVADKTTKELYSLHFNKYHLSIDEAPSLSNNVQIWNIISNRDTMAEIIIRRTTTDGVDTLKVLSPSGKDTVKMINPKVNVEYEFNLILKDSSFEISNFIEETKDFAILLSLLNHKFGVAPR